MRCFDKKLDRARREEALLEDSKAYIAGMILAVRDRLDPPKEKMEEIIKAYAEIILGYSEEKDCINAIMRELEESGIEIVIRR